MTRNEERFSRINPEELDPQLQQVYKMLQADYTQKRQQDAETARTASERAAQIEQQYAETAQRFQALQQYTSQVEANNGKWVEYYKYLEQSGQLGASGQQQQGQQFDGQAAAVQQQQALYGRQQIDQNGRMSATDRELLNTNRGEFTPEQAAAFDKYFTSKYGSAFQGLNSQVGKLQQTLGYTLQINELLRTKGKEFDIDPKRIVDAAAELNTDKLDKAFEFAYAKEIEEKRFAERLEKEKESWEAAHQTSALEGLTRQKAETIYQTPVDLPHTYEEVDQRVAENYAQNPAGAWSAPS